MKQATINAIPLFEPVPRRRRKRLASLADEVDVPAGTKLIRQGGYALEFFIVVEGTAEVRRDGEHVATLGPGDFFGEVGLLETAWQRTASVVAVSPMRLLVAGRREFQAMVDTHPSIAEPIRRAATARR